MGQFDAIFVCVLHPCSEYIKSEPCTSDMYRIAQHLFCFNGRQPNNSYEWLSGVYTMIYVVFALSHMYLVRYTRRFV